MFIKCQLTKTLSCFKFSLFRFPITFITLLFFSAPFLNAQNVSLYYDASIKNKGFSYNITLNITELKTNNTLHAGGWIVKLISITPDSKGYFSRGKTDRYYSCSELGSFCNPNKFDKVIVGIKYQCKNNGEKTITFENINQEQKIVVNKEPNTDCSIQIEGVTVWQSWSDEPKYRDRIKELEYPKQNNPIANNTGTISNTSENSKSNTKNNDNTTSEYIISNSNTSNKPQNKTQLTKEEQDKKAVEEFMKKQAELEAAKEKRIKQQSENFQNKVNAVAKSYYAGQASQNAKDGIKSNSRLDGNYSSLEEMRADYSQKNQAIYFNTESLKQSQKEATQANYDLYFHDADEKGKAIGNVAAGITNIVNDIKADEERKKAQQQLNEDRKKFEAQIKAEEEKKRLKLKNDFITEFKDGGVPNSSSKISENEVYFFTYVYNKNDLALKTTTVEISNVYPISKYGDGTWLLKNGLINKLSKFKENATNTIIIIGYYCSQEQAEELRKTFISIGKEIGFSFHDFYFKGNPYTNLTENNTDYWGNPKIKTGINTENPKSEIEYDYWGNPIKKTTQNAKIDSSKINSEKYKPAKIKTGINSENSKSKIEYDYWGNPIKK